MTDSMPTSRRTLGALCAATATLVMLAGCTSGSPSSPQSPAAKTSAAPEVSEASGARDLQDNYQDVVRNVLPSVVQITTSEELGSGIVYDTKGHIVTNAHVVGKNTTFQVTLANGNEPLKATLVASYPEQDLAVIALEKPPSDLRAARFADSAKVEVGQIALAMGSPLGLSGSVTQGIVSALGRTVTETAAGGAPGATIANLVQTSAPINPGNSGGALVNLSGEIIGIPTLGAVNPTSGNGSNSAPGIGFAIPSSTITRIADQIIKNGKVTSSGRAALGVTGRTVLGPDFTPAGVAVISVVKNGPADKAGIEPGDIIIGVGNTEIQTSQALSEALAPSAPGKKVDVTFVRDGNEKTVAVTLGEL